ncbi:FkbM family methyltransferase [Desulfosporosinus sp. BICA1-9]|uniref:FkbM family methyltransferase n=1 Tax=Desulfosporosinus sp. BICA1-9 TaxID=1531958 RepID=UPI00054C417C|nr:FkbM family methyltransferase [Desulfosporosinus sp. BICA1-9]KJS90319.1 MAG: hypothetical protein JL57_02485 [Desulfosporosinus sp. BICA1-9]HBW38557.1 FkbM family methyltransferase [Desulfosporosinus sp.]
MHGTYIGNQKMLVFPAWGGGKLILPSEDLSLMPELIQTGLIEPPLSRYLINHVKESSVVMDIGANIGYYTVLLGYLVGLSGKVIAYEANPQIFSILQDNVSLNYLFDHVQVINKAVYSTRTVLPFHMSRKFNGNSSINKHNETYTKNYPGDSFIEIQVNAEPLDIYLNTVERVDLIKIDIEGGEYQCFLGMENLLRKGRIKKIIFEYNWEMLQQDAEPFYKLLKMYSNEGAIYHSFSPQGEPVSLSIGDLADRSYPNVLMEL